MVIEAIAEKGLLADFEHPIITSRSTLTNGSSWLRLADMPIASPTSWTGICAF